MEPFSALILQRNPPRASHLQPVRRIRWDQRGFIIWILLLFCLALFSRISFFWIADFAHAPLLFDEIGYYNLAQRWHQLFRSLPSIIGRSQSELLPLLVEVYQPVWPPLYPFLLSFSFLFPGNDIINARLFNIIAGSFSVPLFYMVVYRLTANANARLFSAIYAITPSFLFYSSTLWSDTLFIMFLLIAILLMQNSTINEQRFSHSAVLSGAFLGAATLLRATGLFAAAAALLWLAFQNKSGRRAAVLAALSFAVVVGPWQVALSVIHHGLNPITVSGPINIALGNSAHTPAYFGSSWGHRAIKAELAEEAARIGAARVDEIKAPSFLRGTGWEDKFRSREAHRQGLRELAFNYIRQHPFETFSHALTRIQLTLQPDFFVDRHVFFGLIFTGRPTTATYVIWLGKLFHMIQIGGIVFFIAQAPPTRQQWLLAGLAAALVFPSALTIGMSRLFLPAHVLFLAWSATMVGPFRRRRRLVVPLLLAAIVVAFVGAGLWKPCHVVQPSDGRETSIIYTSVYDPLLKLFGSPSPCD